MFFGLKLIIRKIVFVFVLFECKENVLNEKPQKLVGYNMNYLFQNLRAHLSCLWMFVFAL